MAIITADNVVPFLMALAALVTAIRGRNVADSNHAASTARLDAVEINQAGVNAALVDTLHHSVSEEAVTALVAAAKP